MVVVNLAQHYQTPLLHLEVHLPSLHCRSRVAILTRRMGNLLTSSVAWLGGNTMDFGLPTLTCLRMFVKSDGLNLRRIGLFLMMTRVLSERCMNKRWLEGSVIYYTMLIKYMMPMGIKKMDTPTCV